MNIKQMQTNEIALLLHGLRAVVVTDEEATRQRLMKRLEDELSRRGARLAHPEEKKFAA